MQKPDPELRPLAPLEYQRRPPPVAQPALLPIIGLALLIEAAIALVFRTYYATRPLGPILVFGLAVSFVGLLAWRGYRWARWFLAIILYFKAMILFGSAIAMRQQNPIPLVVLGLAQLVPAAMLAIVRRRS